MIRLIICLILVVDLCYSNHIDDVQQQFPSEQQQSSSNYWCDDEHEDFVHVIPGYIPIQPPSCWYSGYLTYEISGRLIHTHYTLQTAELLSSYSDASSKDHVENPFQKPLIYWSS